jgi:hypothetical protein
MIDPIRAAKLPSGIMQRAVRSALEVHQQKMEEANKK